jgi:hypothetical protein
MGLILGKTAKLHYEWCIKKGCDKLCVGLSWPKQWGFDIKLQKAKKYYSNPCIHRSTQMYIIVCH